MIGRFMLQGVMEMHMRSKVPPAIALALGLALGFALGPAEARSGGIKFAADYSDLRGFNYNPVSARNGDDKWTHYDHAEVGSRFRLCRAAEAQCRPHVSVLSCMAGGQGRI
jgi:hypothetical protein